MDSQPRLAEKVKEQSNLRYGNKIQLEKSGKRQWEAQGKFGLGPVGDGS